MLQANQQRRPGNTTISDIYTEVPSVSYHLKNVILSCIGTFQSRRALDLKTVNTLREYNSLYFVIEYSFILRKSLFLK